MDPITIMAGIGLGSKVLGGIFGKKKKNRGPNYSGLYGQARMLQGRYNDFYKQAMGINFGVTDQDRSQYQQSYGYARDLIQQDLLNKLPGLVGEARGNAGARGLGGSAMAQGAAERAQLSAMGNAGQALNQWGMQQAGTMQQMAQQRGAMELSRNQALWQNLLQAYQPSFDIGLAQAGYQANRQAAGEKADAGFWGEIAKGAAPYVLDHLPWGKT